MLCSDFALFFKRIVEFIYCHMVKSSGEGFSQLQEAQASTNNSLTGLNEQIGDLHIDIFRYVMSKGSTSNRQVSNA